MTAWRWRRARRAARTMPATDWMPDPDLSRAMESVLPDDVWWHLMLSEWTGPVTLAEAEAWTLPQIARALVVAEAMDARTRYDAAMQEARRG